MITKRLNSAPAPALLCALPRVSLATALRTSPRLILPPASPQDARRARTPAQLLQIPLRWPSKRELPPRLAPGPLEFMIQIRTLGRTCSHGLSNFTVFLSRFSPSSLEATFTAIRFHRGMYLQSMCERSDLCGNWLGCGHVHLLMRRWLYWAVLSDLAECL